MRAQPPEPASSADAAPTPALRGPRLALRVACYLAYTIIGKHLPRSYRPFGMACRRLRGWLARGMFDYCGSQVNVEYGAIFGTGWGVRLGDRSDIGVQALIIGPVSIGRDVMMGPRCTLLASSHNFRDLAKPMNQQGMAPDRVIRIEDDVWVSAGCTILAGRTIGRGSVVAAGSVVTKDVEPFSIVAGNPARLIGRRDAQVVSPQPRRRPKID